MSASAHHEPLPAEPVDGTTPDAGWADHRGTRVIRGHEPVSREPREDVGPRARALRGADDARARFDYPAASAPVAPLPELTATGAALTVGLITSFAGIVDRLLSPGLGLVFGFVFVLASVYAAIRLCWHDAWAALALPPLAFVSAAGISAQFSSSAEGGWVTRTSTEIATAVLGHPIYLLTGTVLAAACLAYRARVE